MAQLLGETRMLKVSKFEDSVVPRVQPCRSCRKDTPEPVRGRGSGNNVRTRTLVVSSFHPRVGSEM